MSDDTASRIGWGVVLDGEAFDLEDWQGALKQPFDPWVVATEDGLILRSKLLEPATTPNEAHDLALPLMDMVNGALGVSHSARVVRPKAIAEVLSDGTHRQHVLLQIAGAEIRDKATFVAVVLGSDGKPKPAPPPEPSNPQRWLSIAAEDDLLADALAYFARGDDWFDVYKALECLEMRFGGEKKGQVERFRRLGWADPDKIELLKQTANSGRHARKKFDPPPQPMERTEARDLLAKLIARAFHEQPIAPQPPRKRRKGGE